METVRTDLEQVRSLPPPRAAGAESLPLPRHIPELDGIRGLAILLVLLTHFCDYIHVRSPWLSAPFAVAQAGWCGVDLFFVLSGFLITGILWDAKPSKHFFRNFYARRVVRIFPLYYGTLFVLFVVLPAVEPGLSEIPLVGDLVRDLSDRLSRARAFGSGYFWLHAANVLSSSRGWVFPEHFWSLAVEEHFYLFWPIAVCCLRRTRLMAVSVGIALAAVVTRFILLRHSASVSIYVLTPCRMDALAVGAFLALAARGPRGIQALVVPARAVLAGTGLLWLALALRSGGWLQYSPSTQGVGYSLVAAFFGSLIVLAVGSGPTGILSTTFKKPVLRFFGKYSYGLYVLHIFPACLLPRFFALDATGKPSVIARAILGGWAFGLHGAASPTARVLEALLYLGAGVMISVVLAWCSWHFFERWFLTYKKYFEYDDRAATADGQRSRQETVAGLRGVPLPDTA